MRIRPLTVCVAVMLAIVSLPAPALVGAESVVGKWMGKAETPDGPLDMELEFREEGGQILASAVLFQQRITVSGVKFQAPDVTFQLRLGESDFKLAGVLQSGALTGTWEQIGGGSKGTWTAQRAAAAPPPKAAAAGSPGISGTWHVVAATDSGQREATMQLKHEGETVTGTIGSETESLPLRSGSFRDDRLQFDVDLHGAAYRIQAALDGDRMTGTWGPAAGGAAGPFTASRQPATASAGTGESVTGVWDSVASTPDGDLPFALEISQSGNSLSAAVSGGGEKMPVSNVSFSAGKLTFEVEYAGGRYRMEATLGEGKLAGKWSAVGGHDSGPWSAARRKP